MSEVGIMEQHEPNRPNPSARPPPAPAPQGSPWWTWGLGLLGFVIGCEVNVQRFLFGMPATPMLLAAGGAILGTVVARRPVRGQAPGTVSSLRSDLRRLLKALLIGWLVLVMVISGVGLVMFLWPRLFPRDQRTDKGPPEGDRGDCQPAVEIRAVGAMHQMEANVVVQTFRNQGVYLVRDTIPEDVVFALKAACAHCGRTVNWLEAEKKFKCPHCGSGYKISGERFEGPARRSLARLAIRRGGDGDLVIDPARRFQKELGQWNDAASFLRP
jgi:Rieske Fe-S protein